MGGIAAAHPLREPPVRPAGTEDPPARGGHHRLGPDPFPLRPGVTQDPARPHRTGGGARPADHALGWLRRLGLADLKYRSDPDELPVADWNLDAGAGRTLAMSEEPEVREELGGGLDDLGGGH